MADKIFTFRIDEKVLDKLRNIAEGNKRSIAKEVEYILEKHIEHIEDLNSRAEQLAASLKQKEPHEVSEWLSFVAQFEPNMLPPLTLLLNKM